MSVYMKSTPLAPVRLDGDADADALLYWSRRAQVLFVCGLVDVTAWYVGLCALFL